MHKKSSKVRCIGILTAGGDCPGLNAAIRGVAKGAMHYGIHVIGICDGFRGLVENRTMVLDDKSVSGILTMGGTLLGTSRAKPHKMDMGGQVMDMTNVAIANARRLQIDCLVCLGGNGTQKNTLHLHKSGGIDVMTLPKTIDNDVAESDISFGFDTAMAIATEAIDRLHTTATSHHRIIVCEVMGNKTGWLALGSGTAGGADVILIPEIPYDLQAVADHLKARRRSGKRFSIIAVAEGAMSMEEAQTKEAAKQAKQAAKAAMEKQDSLEKLKTADKSKKTSKKMTSEEKKGKKKKETDQALDESSEYDVLPPQKIVPSWQELQDGVLEEIHSNGLIQEPMSSRLARELQQLTGIEARVTSLGHVQRGGIPSPYDRLLCTRLGTKASQLLAEGVFNVMVAVKGDLCLPVALEQVAGRTNTLPLDHPWIETARLVQTCLGDKSG